MNYIKSNFDSKHLHNYSATIEDIEKYSNQVMKRKVTCNLPDCVVCKVSSNYFKQYEARQRLFLIVEDQFIKRVHGLLIRWVCSGCGKTYTDYPWFALPYKRYTLPTIMALCNEYLEKVRLSYRRLIQKLLFGYRNSEKQLEHSTIHRWITTFGRLAATIAKAQDLILKKNPASSICRDLAVMPISPLKYRSLKRKKTLLKCRRLIHIETVFRLTFDVSIFPKLATDCFFT